MDVILCGIGPNGSFESREGCGRLAPLPTIRLGEAFDWPETGQRKGPRS